MTKKLIALKLRSLISAMGVSKKKGQGAVFSKSRLVGYLLVYLYIGATFSALSAGAAYTLGSLFIPLGFEDLYFGLFISAALALVFVFSIFETKSMIFESRDNDLLLSLPIKARDVVLSRISVVLIYNYIETFIVMIPAIVVYAILGGAFITVVGACTVTLVLPFVATSLSSGIGYLVAFITKKTKNKSFFTTVFYLAFLALYFIGYNSLTNGITRLAESSNEFLVSFAVGLGFFDFIGSAARFELIPFVSLILVAILLVSASYVFISRNFISIVIGTSGSGVSLAVYRGGSSKKHGAFYAVVTKEIRGFLNSPLYMLNCGLGIILCIVLGVMALVKSEDILLQLPIISLVFERVTDTGAFFFSMLPSVLTAVASTVYISTPALSLEGKRLWIIKSLPISGKTLLFAKTLPHIIFGAPAVLLMEMLFIAAFRPDAVFIPFIIITPLIGVVFYAFLGGVIGAALCRFDYQSDVHAIKQSAASMVSALGTLLLSLGFIALSAWLSMTLSPIISVVVFTFTVSALACVCALLLSGALTKKYDGVDA